MAQAELDAPLSGYDTKQFYVMPTKKDSTLDLEDTSNTDVDASSDNPAIDASLILKSPTKDYYVGWLTGNGVPPNGAPYGFGITFPSAPVEGQFFLRTDYYPNRLFRWSGQYWMKFEDNVRMTMTNRDDPTQGNVPNPESGIPQSDTRSRQTQKTGFINNTNQTIIAGEVVQERQALSQVLKPKADN